MYGTRMLVAMAMAMSGTVASAGWAGELAIDDFDDGDLEAVPGLSWMVIADDAVGGTGHGELAVVGSGRERVLRLDGATGSPRPGVPVSFVGVWTPVSGDGLPRDLSGYAGIRLRARVTSGRFFVGTRGTAMANFMAPLPSGREWIEVDVPFSDLRPLTAPGAEPPSFAPADVAWVGLSASGTEAGPVRLELDRIAFYGGPDATGAPTPAGAGRGFRAVRRGLVDPTTLRHLRWTVLAEEAAGDGLRSGLPDATGLAWARDEGGRVWFRVDLAGPPPDAWFGINIAFEAGAGEGMAWWGTNDAFRFGRLVTAYLSRVGGGAWQGSLGVADAGDVGRGVMAGITAEVSASIDRERPALLVGIPADALPSGPGPLRLIATVGSAMVNNDDLPDEGAVELRLPGAGS